LFVIVVAQKVIASKLIENKFMNLFIKNNIKSNAQIEGVFFDINQVHHLKRLFMT
tara:strand:- start:5745 stop:5909 length:165 start_codon:yes stop_codon:yes gene_type:complete